MMEWTLRLTVLLRILVGWLLRLRMLVGVELRLYAMGVFATVEDFVSTRCCDILFSEITHTPIPTNRNQYHFEIRPIYLVRTCQVVCLTTA